MKTFDKKDVFTVVTTEEAKEYIGKEGYFGDDLRELKDEINNETYNILTGIYPRVLEEYDDLAFCKNDSAYFRYFLPVDKVKEIAEPKKLRPFKSVKEFVETTGLDIGQCVFIRKTKGDFAKQWTTKALITAITDYVGDTPSITFGDDCWSVEELAEKYEYSRDTTRWYPFGIEE